MADDKFKNLEPGEVAAVEPGDIPPISTLVQAFHGQGLDAATDAIVLRGYLGRSDVVRRTLNYLERAKALEENTVLLKGVTKFAEEVERPKEKEGEGSLEGAVGRLGEMLTSAGEALRATDAAGGQEPEAATGGRITATAIDDFTQSLKHFAKTAPETLPWRLYLTPRLDTYVDFHQSCLLAYRREAKTDRYDACTVWLRVFEKEGNGIPIQYRVVQETMLGPSFALWLDGAVVDDYVDQRGSAGSAWGDQSSILGGGKWPTGAKCGGKWPTGARCGE